MTCGRLHTRCIFTHLILTATLWLGILVLFLQRRKWDPKEVKRLLQGHTVGKRLSWDLNSALTTFQHFFLIQPHKKKDPEFWPLEIRKCSPCRVNMSRSEMPQ